MVLFPLRSAFQLAKIALIASLTSVVTLGALLPGQAHDSANPILPGYYADPSVLQRDGHYYIYATLDPWGGETLGCWESTDFKNWNYINLNWPTKTACTSPTSKSAMVWAPSVVQTEDGRLFMYVSVGNEVWVGTAENPVGPWRNALGDRPLIPENMIPGYHMIDAEAFIDDDGSAYLYWGSGWNWTNGKCWAVKLNNDMVSYEGKPRDVTPGHYFEGPFMFKRNGHYYLTYSEGRTDRDTYEVRYAMGDNPFGPFIEAANSPLLNTHKDINVISPGHHAIFRVGSQDYIAYHRQNIPFEMGQPLHRQTCVDEISYTQDGLINNVTPTHEGPALVQRSDTSNLADKAIVTASSRLNDATQPACVIDNNYATLWSAPDQKGAWIQLDLEKSVHFTQQILRFEYAWKPYAFRCETSADGLHWSQLADYSEHPVQGSPIVIKGTGEARYLRLVFPANDQAATPALFEWAVK